VSSLEPGEVTDHARWLRALNGDPNGFSEIYDHYADRVLGYALRQTRSWELAEDVVSITFLEAWRRRDNVRFDDDGRNAKLVLGVVLERDALGTDLYRRPLPAWHELDSSH